MLHPRLRHRRPVAAVLCAALLGLVLLTACSDDDDPVTPPPSGDPEVSGTLGAAGGTLTSGDGTVALTLPAGALAADTEITVRPLEGADLPDLGAGMTPLRAFALEPAGTALAAEGTLSFPVELPAAKGVTKQVLIPASIVTADGIPELAGDETVQGALSMRVDGATGESEATVTLPGLPSTVAVVLLDDLVATGDDPVVTIILEVDEAPVVDTSVATNLSFEVPDALTLTAGIRYLDQGNTGLAVGWQDGATLTADTEGEIPGGYYYGYLPPVTATEVGATSLRLGFELDLEADYTALYGEEREHPLVIGETKLAYLLPGADLTVQPAEGGGDDWLASGTYSVRTGLEGLSIVYAPGNKYDKVALVSGDDGTTGHNLGATNPMATRLTRFSTPGQRHYLGLTVSYALDDKTAPVGMTYVDVGESGLVLNAYDTVQDDFGWSQLAYIGQNLTDVQTFGGGPISDGFVVVDNTSNLVGVFEYDTGNGQYEQVGRITSFEEPDGSAVSAAVRPGGHALIVADGTPGRIYTHDRSDLYATAAYLGDAGDSPRRVRAAGGLAVVSNFASDDLTVLTWSESDEIAVVGTVPVGDGPVGIDLRELPGGNVAVASTGFNDDSYSVTVLSPTGSVVSNAQADLPAGAEGPGHVIWLGDPDNRLLISCNESGDVVVLDPGVD